MSEKIIDGFGELFRQLSYKKIGTSTIQSRALGAIINHTYVFSLPGHLKIGTFRGKKLLKDSFHNRLPKWSMSLPKKGFEVPINDWLRSNLKSMVEDSCSKKSLEKLGIVNKGIVDDWKQGLYSGKRDTSWQLWTLISYKQWLESKGQF